MIRRPPSAIPLKQDDVVEMEAFLAEKRAALLAAEQNEAMQVETQQTTAKGKGKGKASGAKTTKGKGKQRSDHVADDSLVEAEEQTRQARDAQTREQRIGL